MSMDNGYVIRKNSDNKFVLQMYFASCEEYPDIEDERALKFDTLEDAVQKYEELEDSAMEHGYPLCEYGLSIHTRV